MSEGTAAVEFAALLRQLKDRSGLSYGVLGKRLHMSTSTLHRYCNGDAVPTDYAPVERLARLCKASPDELVELHRRWVLADGARGKKGAAEAAASSDAPALVPDAPGPLEPDGAVRQDGRRRLRRRTAAIAGTGLAAVLGVVVLAMGLPSGGDQGDEGRGSPVGAATTKGVSGGPTRTEASASPSPSPSTRSRERNSPSPSLSPTPSRNSARGAETADEPPLTVNTRPYTWEGPCSQHYLIDRPATDVGPPPVEQDAPAWVGAHKAVSAGEQLVKLTVQGTGEETVVVDSLRVRVVGKDTPPDWNDYVMGVGCGGGVPTRPFSVALDAARPTVVAGDGQRDFPFKVSESDPEVFEVTADASAYDVRWYLELAWSSGDRKGTLVVDDDGRPFRTSGNNGRPAYEFPLGGQKWSKSVGG
ncbi:helix-turn-helix domain-containing protein [Streptomyces chartreusis]|uniref:Helix-turn-helix domain-containing protein n=1 Tax=Streptomyces chartreusis TaxID=1969 RepID=A0A7H8TQ58_STRCX|nr:helix-turn-helix transcriptional regulator [Streptomyces chartreusis]QKZ24270.1 helix-turn-helix domain-containing protein [Streptomyces chartreusis]